MRRFLIRIIVRVFIASCITIQCTLVGVKCHCEGVIRTEMLRIRTVVLTSCSKVAALNKYAEATLWVIA